MRRNYPKHIKKLIREYGAIAFDRELSRELQKLAYYFNEWKEGNISSEYLSNMVYKFTVGPSRQLYSRYNNSVIDMAVAYAIVNGILNRDDLPDELLQHLERAMEFYEEMRARGE
ncbi:MAG: hypothetical protein L0229_21675 [Blastocatellia bacterium]|nr:hypothetical protein [Blastocatellia bacterium]